MARSRVRRLQQSYEIAATPSVDRETRFKTKAVVDVVIYRGRDVWWDGVFAFLSEGFGLTFTALSLVGGADRPKRDRTPAHSNAARRSAAARR